MKITRANVEAYAKTYGLEPLERDGIPDGFIWKEADVNIDNTLHRGKILIFKPLAEWADEGAITNG